MRTHSTLWSYLSLIVIGIGIGCLIGLSISPVISIVISSVTGTAAAIVAAMTGLERPGGSDDAQPAANRWQINPIPFALLMLGLLAGAALGISARNTHVLGSDISAEVAKWSKTGLTEQEITQRIFEAQYPENASNPSSTSPAVSPGGSVLFAIGTDDCDQLYAASLRSDQRLIDALENVDQLAPLTRIVTDPQQLREIVEEVLCP